MARGTRQSAKGQQRRYQCTPAVGAPHRFTVTVVADQAVLAARWTPPPACPAHPGSKVVRAGTYATSTAKRRQRYRCTPADGTKFHVFTPVLPRDHVHEGAEQCEACEEVRGVHRGDTAVARRHTWSTRVVVRGLELMAGGMSYAETGRWAHRVTGTSRTQTSSSAGPEPEEDPFAPIAPTPTPRKTSAAAKAARNAWHIGADWVEAFSPVIYDPIDARLRDAACVERARLDEQWANGEVLEQPQVVLVDDVPVYGAEIGQKTKRRDAGFYALALAETAWGPVGPAARLRLVRAMAKSNTPAWRLLFDELGYAPDFVVADAGTGIIAAVERHFDPARTKFIPSMWHLGQRIELALAGTAGAKAVIGHGPQLIPPIAEHMRKLHHGSAALTDAASWSAWWDELEAAVVARKLPLDKIGTQRRNNEARFAAVIDDLNRYPLVPVSTGGLETLIAKHVKPLMAMRRTAFANLERTNLLFDLTVAAHHGAFDHPEEVAALLRANAASSDAAAVAALWAGVRLAVVDVETVTDGNELRVVSVGVVTARAGLVRGKWQTLVDPDMAVDAGSAQFHRLTEEHLHGEPSFAAIADNLRGALTAADDEQLVFVAHNVGFDAGVLRAEYQRIGQQLPELPILDTGGRLAQTVGVKPTGGSLAALADALGLTNDRPHDALADALVCAEAAVELLNTAARHGERDFTALLTAVSGTTTTLTVKAVTASQLLRRVRSKVLPPEHVAGHAVILSARAGPNMLAEWRTAVGECATLRCRNLDDRVANARPPAPVLIAELEAVLADRCTAGDTPGAATVLGALLPLLPDLPPMPSGRLADRRAFIAWAHHWLPLLAPLGRCGDSDRCPTCRGREPCPLDTWADTIGPAALSDPAQTAKGFLGVTGKRAMVGVFTTWTADGLTPVADAALWACVGHWRAIGLPEHADQVVRAAWSLGCRHPDVADAYAGQLAAAGRTTDLRAALAVCEAAMRTQNGSSHDGWTRLHGRTQQLAGRLERRRVRPSGLFDEDGNPIPVRRHHPQNPQRVRPPRFRRTEAG
ncbi:3'-5' exonuclease [Iamia sp. SCSIO 61187]|uniref:3'-5' exonuclease n=1 Tax=Iamia sp. SCSIO 61187 TaxID=2722752 RepID=UPI001C628B74|nr:3'-5' exonuclease [Iamia sp. SCSIO 61187]QYG94490.1 3'-5' exonuclease [Iamia sp. SCSIO 61187]